MKIMPVSQEKAIVQSNRLEYLRKKYFAVMRVWYQPYEAKDVLKSHFKLQSFNDATAEQLEYFINQVERGE